MRILLALSLAFGTWGLLFTLGGGGVNQDLRVMLSIAAGVMAGISKNSPLIVPTRPIIGNPTGKLSTRGVLKDIIVGACGLFVLIMLRTFLPPDLYMELRWHLVALVSLVCFVSFSVK